MRSTDHSPITVGLSAAAFGADDASAQLDGIGSYTRALERGLREIGVLTCRIGAPGLYTPWRAPLTDVAFGVPFSVAIAAAAVGRIYAPLARGVERRIDVYHATDYRVPKLRETLVVATLYDAIPLMRPEWANPRLRRVKNWLLRSAAASADRVIAISEAAVNELVEYYRIPRARIHVIPLGVDDRWFAAPADSISSVRSLGIEPGYFLFVGTLQPRKNIGALLDAYDRLPAAVRAQRQLVVVGKYGWGADRLRADLRTRRSAGRCIWLEYVPEDLLQQLYASAGTFVFPSLAEGFGLPILEAMAAGLPVVANDLPVLREVAGSLGIFVNANNADDLANALTVTADTPSDPILVAKRRERARRFTWSACAERTLAVYRAE
jgi:glycosyltransferase involved in cell wall biosynthesis